MIAAAITCGIGIVCEETVGDINWHSGRELSHFILLFLFKLVGTRGLRPYLRPKFLMPSYMDVQENVQHVIMQNLNLFSLKNRQQNLNSFSVIIWKARDENVEVADKLMLIGSRRLRPYLRPKFLMPSYMDVQENVQHVIMQNLDLFSLKNRQQNLNSFNVNIWKARDEDVEVADKLMLIVSQKFFVLVINTSRNPRPTALPTDLHTCSGKSLDSQAQVKFRQENFIRKGRQLYVRILIRVGLCVCVCMLADAGM